MDDQIKFVALGGLDEPGKSCYVVEINDDIFVLDAGLCLPDKSIPGVDFVLPNFDYLIQNKSRIKAYIMTHGHDENIGALEYFHDEAPAPIYCTHSTEVIIRSQSERSGIMPKWDFRIVNASDSVYIANRKVQFFQTAHNASYSFGVAISTSRGNVIYTSDFIIDFNSKDKAYFFDLKQLEKIAVEPTFLLIAESKNANKEGYCAPKHKVDRKIEKYFEMNNKRIFITSFWQNFFRINEICRLAVENHKKVYFYNDYTKWVMEKLMSADESICLKKSDILAKEDLLRVRNQDVVILLLGRGKKLYEEMTLLVNKENEDKRIVLGENDIFINCALPTPTLETLATRSVDNLYRSECDVVWIKSKDVGPMHASQDDLKFFLSSLKPQYYVPVRGSYVGLMANAHLALSMNIGFNYNNIFILDNGMQLLFKDNNRPVVIPNDINKINISPVLVDGLGISKTALEVISDRTKLGVDGVVIVAATVSKTNKKIIAGPDCQMRGFVYAKEAEPLLKSISQIFIDEVNTAFSANANTFETAINNIKERSRRYIIRENGREPMIIPIIIPLID